MIFSAVALLLAGFGSPGLPASVRGVDDTPKAPRGTNAVALPRWVFALKLESTGTPVNAPSGGSGFGGGGLGSGAAPAAPAIPQLNAEAVLATKAGKKFAFKLGESLPPTFIDSAEMAANAQTVSFGTRVEEDRVAFSLDPQNRIRKVVVETPVSASDARARWSSAYDKLKTAYGEPSLAEVRLADRIVTATWWWTNGQNASITMTPSDDSNEPNGGFRLIGSVTAGAGGGVYIARPRG